LRKAIEAIELQHAAEFAKLAEAMDQDTTLNTTTASSNADTSLAVVATERTVATPMVVLFNTVGSTMGGAHGSFAD